MSEVGGESTPNKETALIVRFNDLLRDMILEGVVDPHKGTQFTIIQTEISGELLDERTFPPVIDLSKVAETGSHVFTVGIPNPLEVEVEDLLLTPDEHSAKELLSEIELRGTFDQLTNRTKNEGEDNE